jgi:hypothetical protein
MTKRRLSYFILALTFSFFAWTHAASAATTWYVNSSTGSDVTGNGTSSPFQTFTRAYASSTANDTIDLTGTFDWSNPAETAANTSAGFTLNKALTIRGQGATSTFIQASSTPGTAVNKSVFTTFSTIVFQNLTIRYGNATSSGSRGGGITNYGNLTLKNVILTQNKNAGTQGTANYVGGAIYSDQSTTLTISSSTLSNNTVYGYAYGAGGLYVNQTATVNITGSTFSGNTGIAYIPTIFPYSYADISGAISVFRSSPTIITNSTISGNSTNGYGGALNMQSEATTLTNTTVANNTAGYGAAGILWYSSSAGTKIYLENTILANNVSSSTIPDDFYSVDSGTSASAVQDNGYNIIEYSTNKTFSGTGDITGNQTSLNLSNALADNGNPIAQTLALLLGSVAINAGTSTLANNSVAVPTYDQRGIARVGLTDIGSYEYNGSSDVTPPAISSLSTSTGQTTANFSFSTNESATSSIQFGTSTSYGSTLFIGTATTSHAFAFSSLTPSTTYHYKITVTDTSGNSTSTQDATVVTATPDTTPPVISNISTSTTQTTATITFSTNESATSSVQFGTTTAYGNTPVISSATTSHSYSFSALALGTTYHFLITAADTSGNISTTTDLTLMTNVAPDVTPPNILSLVATTTDTSVSISFDTDELATSSVRFGTSTSYGTTLITSPAMNHHTYSFTGLSSSTTYYYMVTVTDTSGNTATTSPQTATTQATPTNTNKSFNNYTTSTNSLTVVPPASYSGGRSASSRIQNLISISVFVSSFSRDLTSGKTGSDVKSLQQYLNAKGFIVAISGAGSPGNETTYFGPATKAALIKFQKAMGISPTSGYFGPITRGMIVEER